MSTACIIPLIADPGRDPNREFNAAGPARRARLQRAVLQSAKTAFDIGLCQPNRLRVEDAVSLSQCPRNRGQLINDVTVPRRLGELRHIGIDVGDAVGTSKSIDIGRDPPVTRLGRKRHSPRRP